MTAALFVWWAKYFLMTVALVEFVFLAYAISIIVRAERDWWRAKRGL